VNLPPAVNTSTGTECAAPPRPERRLVVLLAVLLAVGTAALYAPAIRNGFVNYDDPDYVTRNAHVLEGLTWPNLAWAFGTNNPAANWHPLTWISHMTDVQLYGTRPAGHHFTNILFQVLNVSILFLLLERATSHTFRSAAVAALFALHPLNVEAVAWVADRKGVLCVTFLLLTLWAYGRYTRRPGLGRYLWVVLFFALGLMSKIMLIALPLGLLVLDYWPLDRLSGTKKDGKPRSFVSTFLNLVIEKIPLLLLAAAAGGMTIYMHQKEASLASTMPLVWRLKNVIYSYVAYLGKAIWPSRLAVFYPHPENSLPWSTVILAAIVLTAISGIVWCFRRRRYLLVGWLWYLVTLAPMSGIVQSGRQGMADRYMYIPMAGLLLAVVWLLGDWAARLKFNPGLLAACWVVLVSPYVYVTRTQIGYWRNSYTLFTHTLQVTTNNGIAENNLGAALLEMGQPQLAAEHFEAAVRYIPEFASAHYNLAVILQRQNRLEEAARQYHLAIAQSSDPLEAAQAHNNLGMLYLALKDYTTALTELSAAIALNSNEQNSYIGRGMIELQSFGFDSAIADFSQATHIAPSPAAYYWLGRALEGKGDFGRAASAYAAALQLAPGLKDARARLEALHTKARE
jgi:protein O-mannosyl-transferase